MREDGNITASTETDMVAAMEKTAGFSKSTAKRAATVVDDLTLHKQDQGEPIRSLCNFGMPL